MEVFALRDNCTISDSENQASSPVEKNPLGFDELLNYSGAGLYLQDAASRQLVWTNQNFQNIIGFDSTDCKTPNFFDLIIERVHPDDSHKIMDYLNFSLQKKGASFTQVIRQKNKSGEWLCLLYNVMVHSVNKDNYPVQLKGFVLDLTTHLNRENLLSKYFASNPIGEKGSKELIQPLSKREKEILKLIVNGYTDREIGKELNISYYTADTHRKNIIHKLQVRNTACLAFFAGKFGLI